MAAGDELQRRGDPYLAERDAQDAARESCGGEADRPLPLIRTRRVVLRAFVCIGLLIIIAAEVFGPGWVLWLPTNTILGLTGAGVERALGLAAPSNDARAD